MKNRKIYAIFFTFLISLLFQGCANLGPAYQSQSVESDKAIVYVYRPNSFVGAAMSYDVFNGDKFVTRLHNGGYHPLVVNPGKIHLWGETEAKSEVFLIAKAGDTHYVKGSIGMGLLVGRPHLEVINPEMAKEEIKSTNRIPDIDYKKLQERDNADNMEL